ncbi:MAG: hypothetical protein FIB03_02490 [Anaerolineae bacterium]|nr:hypothetical protein [Anaerolineae bacterium]
MRKRKKQPQADTKEQRIAELEKQLAQALLIIQKQQKQIERLQQINSELRTRGRIGTSGEASGDAVRTAALGGATETAGTQARTGQVCSA